MSGITDTGFEVETLESILSRVELKQLADIRPDLDVSPESPVGQLNAVFANEIAELWQLGQQLYDSGDPDKATGDALAGTSKLSGTIRRGATFTTVVAELDLDAGATIETGVDWAQVAGKPNDQWTPVSNYTASVSGPQPVTFRSETTGPNPLSVDTLTVITGSPAGWNSINNPDPAAIGIVPDSDQLLWERRAASLAATGSATALAIKSDVLASDHDKIVSVEVFTNMSDDTDADGVPPHSFEVLVFDGVGQNADPNKIAQAIYDSAGATDGIYGSTTGNATDADTGEVVAVPFSRPTVKNAYIDITVATSDSIVASELASYIATESQKLVATGKDIPWRQVDSLAFNFTNVSNVTDFAMGTSPSPSGAADIPVSSREIVYFDAGNINVTVA